MEDCLFCKISDRKMPSDKVYEDDKVYAFLDINPVNFGHILLVPKKHCPNIYEINDVTLCQMSKVAKKLSTALKDSLKADGINLLMNNDSAAGQVIFHAHMHIIPRFRRDGLKHWPGKHYQEGHQEEILKKIKKVL